MGGRWRRCATQACAAASASLPGPANGFTLDVIACLERFGALIDWAMLILNPLEPWPGELALPAAAKHDVQVLARVVDYGGLFHDASCDESVLAAPDHRPFRPAGWVEAGRARLERVRPIAERHGLTLLQLACQWNARARGGRVRGADADPGAGRDAQPVEDKRAELAALPARVVLTRRGGRRDRARSATTPGCMALKGGSPDHEGDERADPWPLDERLRRSRPALRHRPRARPRAQGFRRRRAGDSSVLRSEEAGDARKARREEGRCPLHRRRGAGGVHEPRDALLEAGATVEVLSLSSDPVQGFNHLDKGDTFPVDRPVSEASVDDYDAPAAPGGVANPDFLRADKDAISFVRDFFEEGKPVARSATARGR